MIFTGYTWGISFYQGDGGDDAPIEELSFPGEAERDALYNALAEDEDHPEWPDGATRMKAWSEPQYRPAIYGVDYGRGSVSARFGGGYVPRSAYQFGAGE